MAADAPAAPDRTRKAAVGAAFGYASLALGLVSGFAVFPLTVRLVGAHDYGLWLATGGAAGYVLLLDGGVFAVLPWLIAGADGRGDRAQVREHLADALVVGAVLGLTLLAAAVVVWLTPEAMWFVPKGDRETVRGPLALLLAATGVTYPLKPFWALASGLQDVRFAGLLNLAQAGATAGLTLAGVWLGFGLWGLAVATALPTALAHAAYLARARAVAPDVFRGWPPPRWKRVRKLFVEGSGAWLGGFGYGLLTTSGGVVLVALGRPEWATLYAATAKAGQVVQQACWLLPDSTLVGLAQLHGSGDRAAARRVAGCTLHLHLFASGGAAIGLLAFNPAFIRLLLGAGVYAGDYVNALLAAGLVLGSFTHGAFKGAAVVGARPLIGALTLAWGAVHCGATVALTQSRGLSGPGEAALAVGLLAGFAPALLVLRRMHDLSPWAILTGVVGRWLLLLGPFLAVALWIGTTLSDRSPFTLVAAGGACLVLYALAARGLLAGVPWPEGVRSRLLRLWVIPASA